MIRVNGTEQPARHETVAELVARLGIEPRGVAVARNGEIVRRAEWAATPVRDGDVIEIVTAVAGG